MVKSKRLNSDFPDVSYVPAFVTAPWDFKYSDPEQQLLFDQLLGLVNRGILLDELETMPSFILEGPYFFQQAITNDVTEACRKSPWPVYFSPTREWNKEKTLLEWNFFLDPRDQENAEIGLAEKARFEELVIVGQKSLQRTEDKTITFEYYKLDSRAFRKALFDCFFQYCFALVGFEYNLEPKNSKDWVWKACFQKDESIKLVYLIRAEIAKLPRGTKRTVFVLPLFPDEVLMKVSSLFSQGNLSVTFNRFGDQVVCFVQNKPR